MRTVLLALLVPALASGCAAKVKEKRLRAAMDEIWNKGDLSVIDKAYEAELAHEIKRFVQENRDLYPDIKIEIVDVIVQGPKMVTVWEVQGTHAVLDKEVTLAGVSVRKWDGGQFVQEDMYYDLKQVYDQLGYEVIPPQGMSPWGKVAVSRTEAANPCAPAPEAPANPCNPCATDEEERRTRSGQPAKDGTDEQEFPEPE